MCPKCPAAKELMAGQDKIKGETFNAHTPEGLEEARKFTISAVPTVVFFDEDGNEVKRATGVEEAEEVLKSVE